MKNNLYEEELMCHNFALFQKDHSHMYCCVSNTIEKFFMTFFGVFFFQSGCNLNPSNSNLNQTVFRGETSSQPSIPQSALPSNSSNIHYTRGNHTTPGILDNLAHLAASDL